MVSVNVTVAMTPEMLEDIDDEADARGWSRARTIRHFIEQADESPFEKPTVADERVEDEKGAA
jgi:hypothetical protein